MNINENNKFKENISPYLPVSCINSNIVINEISIDELLYIREYSVNEKVEMTTCRPIVNRNDDEARELYESIQNNDSYFVFGIYIFDKELNSNKIIGKISAMDYNSRNCSTEIGYYCLPEFRNKRYIKRALAKLCSFMFEKIALNKIYAQTGSYNKASIKLLESLNFSLDGCCANIMNWMEIYLMTIYIV